jgi:hypothetical protein
MHTQTEIAQLWCPMARLVNMNRSGGVLIGQPVFNRGAVADGDTTHTAVPHGANCIGKACAMFRLESKPNRWERRSDNPDATTEAEAGTKHEGFLFIPVDKEEGEEAYWIETDASIEARRLGYCGLAGAR